MVKNNRKIALIVNNAPCHTQDNKFLNVGRIFFPKHNYSYTDFLPEYNQSLKDFYRGHLTWTPLFKLSEKFYLKTC